MRKYLSIIATLLALFLPNSMVGASKAASREGVGVVLSGGGAKGLYHIGVLQALEEKRL